MSNNSDGLAVSLEAIDDNNYSSTTEQSDNSDTESMFTTSPVASASIKESAVSWLLAVHLHRYLAKVTVTVAATFNTDCKAKLKPQTCKPLLNCNLNTD